MANTDIILIGLGPTAATLANLLAPLGWNIKIFEQNTEIYELPRAVFFDDEVMRTFQKIGLGDEILKCALKMQGMDLINQDGITLASYTAPTEVSSLGWHAGYMFHQPTLEAQLRKNLSHFPNIDIYPGHLVSRLSQDQDRASIMVKGPSGIEIHYSRFLIGCCGARSITRETMKTNVHDYGADQLWIVIDIKLNEEVNLPLKTIQYCDPNRPSTYIPTPGLTRRFELMLMPNEKVEDIAKPEKIFGLLSKWLQPHQYQIIRSAVYEFHALVAEHWRNNNFFLAGDAAHQMPPFLGQGMCSGVKDAANLAWKLDFVLRGFATDNLLDTYEAERKPYVEKVIESDLWLSNMIQTTDPDIAMQRDQHFSSQPPSERKLNPPTIKLGGAHFENSEFCGLPAPQPISISGIKHDDLLGENLTIIGKVFISDEIQKMVENNLIKLIEEPSKQMQDWLTSKGALAILIRPDRYIQAILNHPHDLENALGQLSIACKN